MKTGEICDDDPVSDLRLLVTEDGGAEGRGRIVEVARRLGVAALEVTASESVAMGRSTAATVGLVVIALRSIASVTVQLELSSDGENWKPASSTVLTDAGYWSVKLGGIGSRYVRLRYSANGSPGGSALLAALVKPWKR
ncbi:MAG: hypothetical protein HUU15_18735 [Candidatus Brocadiae bacterium]|nr:hypothetical protein [Candidatus Brocadiia bacterium]